MLNQENVKLGKVRSSIRELFEYGKKRKAEIGEENVFDFSLGNPNVPAPEEVKTALADIIAHTDPIALHGYTSATGAYEVRKVISDYINSRFNAGLDPDCIYMTCGAAASLTITLNALVNTGDEVIVFAPYFPEYKVFSSHAGARLIAVESLDGTFQIDFGKLEAALSPKTKAVIINSPNNPTGATLSLEELKQWVEYALEYDFLLLNDECYSEIYSISKPTSILHACLEIGNERFKNVLALNSISKRSSAPGLRSGFIAGDSNILKPYLQYRTYVGCASPLPLQYAAAFAWSEDSHTESSRAQYAKNLQLAKEILGAKIPNLRVPNETFYVWLPVQNDLEWTKNLLMKENILVLPGSFLSRKNNKGENPGENFVRLALVYEESILKDALLRLQKWL